MAQLIEQGDLFFAFRRRVGAPRVHSLRDVQRMYLVLGSHQPREHFRVFIIGRKHLPEPGVERAWAFNTLTTDDPELIDEEMSGKDYATKTRGVRHLPEAELAGEGAYRLLLREDGASELVYALEQPARMGSLQKELGIHHEGRLLIALRNPDLGRLGGGRGPSPQLPAEIRSRFGGHRWLPVDDPHLLDYPYAQVILMAARGKPIELDASDPHGHDEVKRLLGSRVRRSLDDEPVERPPLKLVCAMCGEAFETRSQFERHVRAAHPPRAPSAADLAATLKGLHFPVTRAQLLERADAKVVELVRQLPDREYSGVTDLTKALKALKDRSPG